MPFPEPRSLFGRAAAAAPLAGRFLLDERGRVPLASLAGGSVLGAVGRAAVRDRNVVLLTHTQRAAALGLLELDGRARRIVLCPPDLGPQHLPLVLEAAEATLIVTDAPALPAAGAACLALGDPARLPAAEQEAEGEGTRRETEWALFTSGTTGPPKMALHTLASLAGAVPPPSGPGECVWSTFYDIRRYGGLQILLRALLGGGSLVLSGAEEPVSDFLRRAAGASVSFISGTPTHWRRALLSPAARAIAPATVRLSGEVADQAILDKLRAAYPHARIAHAFASTEAGVAFEVADGRAGFPAALIGPERAGGITLRVRDGTLRVRSPRAALRYLNAAEPIADAEGFVDTKDLVELRGDRYHFAGRKDGVINVGGLKVHPEEVEGVINRHPGVEMSLVRARRSPIIGAIVVAEIVLADAASRPAANDAALEAEILALCRASLAPHKVPASVRVVPALELTPSGKLRRPHAVL